MMITKKKELVDFNSQKHCMKELLRLIRLMVMEEKLKKMVIIILGNSNLVLTMAKELCMIRMEK